MPSCNEISPTCTEIDAHIEQAVQRFPQIVSTQSLGRSKGKRHIPLLIISHPAIPDHDKQHVLIVGGRHGNEESGRAQALALLDYLCTKGAERLLKKQKIFIMPIANPDGSAADIYKNTDGINPCTDIELPNIAAEGQAFEKALTLAQPDLFIDLHAKGHSGFNFDMVLHPAQRAYTEDFALIWQIMQDMAQAGEACGVPHHIHSMEWPGWNDRGPCAICYDRYKSISLLTESAESNAGCLPLRQRARTGLKRLLAALAHGQKKHPKAAYSGYSNHLVVGSFYLGVVAIGHNSEQRRHNRIRIWKQRDHIAQLQVQMPEQELSKICHLDYRGEDLGDACGIQLQCMGKRRIRRVTLNGHKMHKHPLYKQWSNQSGTFVLVPIPHLKAAAYEIQISYAKIT